MEKRKCLECGEELVGRIDKKFCCDQCRNAHNNRNNSDQTNLVRNVNNILRRNRRVLMQLNPGNDKARVHRDRMLEMGFNFRYFTNITTTKKGDRYYFCYEQGYLPLDERYYLLVARQPKE